MASLFYIALLIRP